MSRMTVVRETAGAAPSHSPPDMMFAPTSGMAQFLGWFSIGLGVAELFAPEELGRLVGVRRTRLIQCFGVREIATGIAILSSSRPTIPMWARVAGDALDLAALGEAMTDQNSSYRTRAARAAIAVAGVTAMDAISATALTAASRMEG